MCANYFAKATENLPSAATVLRSRLRMDVSFMMYMANHHNDVPRSMTIAFDGSEYWPAWAMWAIDLDNISAQDAPRYGTSP
jgi:hypothetical protein